MRKDDAHVQDVIVPTVSLFSPSYSRRVVRTSLQFGKRGALAISGPREGRAGAGESEHDVSGSPNISPANIFFYGKTINQGSAGVADAMSAVTRLCG